MAEPLCYKKLCYKKKRHEKKDILSKICFSRKFSNKGFFLENFPYLNTRCVVNIGKFGKTVKSFFPDKSNNSESLTLVENDRIVSDDIEVANILF